MSTLSGTKVMQICTPLALKIPQLPRIFLQGRWRSFCCMYVCRMGRYGFLLLARGKDREQKTEGRVVLLADFPTPPEQTTSPQHTHKRHTTIEY